VYRNAVQIEQKAKRQVMKITFKKKVVKTFLTLSAFVSFVLIFRWDKTSRESSQTLQARHGGEQEPLVESFRGDIVRLDNQVLRSQRSAKSFSPEISLFQRDNMLGEKRIVEKEENIFHTSSEKSESKPTDIDDVFISVKTTLSFHKTRLKLLLDTWISTCKKQVAYWSLSASVYY
jgi:hypothetical protein